MGGFVVFLWLILANFVAQVGPQPAVDRTWQPLERVITRVQQQDEQAMFVANDQPFFPIGVTYHFTRNRLTWDYDLSLMARIGLNTVRADLAWRDVVPYWEGDYRFDMLDQFLAAAARHHLRVVLVFSYATADSNVPLWYWPRYGLQEVEQARRGALADLQPSINDPNYRRLMADYIARTVAHVRTQPAVLAYQVLNEPRYTERPVLDRSPHFLHAFRGWLAHRYGTIEQLNGLWQTQHHSFATIQAPVGIEKQIEGTPELVTQQAEDWRQFSYENLAEFVDDLSGSIRAADPYHAVLVAEMSWWWWGEQPATGVSPWHIYQAADIVGFDVYPAHVDDAHYYALNADMLRRYWGKPVWVMELNRKDGKPESGEIRRFAQAAADYGATGIFYFSWRDHPLDGGDYGLLDRWGQPKPQLAAFGQAVAWLHHWADNTVAGLPPEPDVYLVWPTKAVSQTSGSASPAWQVYDEAVKLLDAGKRIGLVDEVRARSLPHEATVLHISN